MKMKKAFAICMIMALLLAAGCAKKVAEAPVNQTVSAAPAAPAVSAATEAPAKPTGDYAFSFSAQTLGGETVTEAFFGQHDLTMVNVWASWCGPCRGELPELGELYGKLPQNVGFLSVTIDEPGDLKAAQDILAQNGCTFPCLDGQASEGLTKNVLNGVMAIPTTLFFDSQGNQVGEMIVGVPQGSSVVDAYMAEIQARLDLLNAK